MEQGLLLVLKLRKGQVLVGLAELLQCLLVELLYRRVCQMGRTVVGLLSDCVLWRLLHMLVLLREILLLHQKLRDRALVCILVLI